MISALVQRSTSARYAIALAIVTLALALRWLLIPIIGTGTLYITLFPAMALAAAILSTGPALFGNLVGIVAIEFFAAGMADPSPLSLSLIVRAGLMLATTGIVGEVGRRLRLAADLHVEDWTA